MTEIKNKISYFSVDPIQFKEGLVHWQAKWINIAFLNGIQLPDEYSNKKRRLIENLYGEYQQISAPNNLTLDFPIICCAIPCATPDDITFNIGSASLVQDMDYYLAILDGHHRVRYGPKFGVKEFYCAIYPLSQSLLQMKKLNRIDSSTNLGEYYNDLIHNISTVLASFSQKGYKHTITPLKIR